MTSCPTPPHSADAERALLGSLFIRPDLIHAVRGLLLPGDFYSPQNRLIYSAILSVVDSNRQIDPVSVGEFLRERHASEAYGGAAHIAELMGDTVTTVHAPSLAKQVKALSAQRGVLAAAQEIAADARSPHDNIDEFLGSAMARMVTAASANTGSDPVHIGHHINQVCDTAMSGETTIMREPTGITEIDNKIYGLPKKKLTVVGGRPGMGKSTLVLNTAKHIARRGPVLFFTLEDDIQSQQSRLISNECGVPYFDLDGGSVDKGLHNAITLATARARDMQIWFEERRLTADEVCQKAIAFRAIKGGLRLCVIDHLGYVVPPGHTYRRSIYEITTDHVRRFAFLAKELRCPVLLCVQLNRGVENRDDKRPRLSDLRDSGRIEEDARQVILLYRESVYDAAARDDELEVIVAKNTQGPTGSIKLAHDIKCCRIGGGRDL